MSRHEYNQKNFSKPQGNAVTSSTAFTTHEAAFNWLGEHQSVVKAPSPLDFFV